MESHKIKRNININYPSGKYGRVPVAVASPAPPPKRRRKEGGGKERRKKKKGKERGGSCIIQ